MLNQVINLYKHKNPGTLEDYSIVAEEQDVRSILFKICQAEQNLAAYEFVLNENRKSNKKARAEHYALCEKVSTLLELRCGCQVQMKQVEKNAPLPFSARVRSFLYPIKKTDRLLYINRRIAYGEIYCEEHAKLNEEE